MGKNDKVLVLGGTGIIGQEVCRSLVCRGLEVYAINRSGRKLSGNIKSIVCDARNADELKDATKNHSFAAVIDLLSFNAQQLSQTFTTLKDVVSQYIFISSATVHKGATGSARITERTEFIEGGWEYPINKIRCEKKLVELSSSSNVPYTIVRPYITYSEQRISFAEWEGQTILYMISTGRAIPIGRQMEDCITSLTHSKDLARGVSGLVANGKALNEDFNIATDEAVVWRDVFQQAADILGKPLCTLEIDLGKIEDNFSELSGKIFDRILERKFDVSKIKKAVPDFKVDYTFANGYQEVINEMLRKGLDNKVNYNLLGRLDGFVSRNGGGKRGMFLRFIFTEHSSYKTPKNAIRYTIGYFPFLYSSARFLKSVLKRKKIPNDYALG